MERHVTSPDRCHSDDDLVFAGDADPEVEGRRAVCHLFFRLPGNRDATPCCQDGLDGRLFRGTACRATRLCDCRGGRPDCRCNPRSARRCPNDRRSRRDRPAWPHQPAQPYHQRAVVPRYRRRSPAQRHRGEQGLFDAHADGRPRCDPPRREGTSCHYGARPTGGVALRRDHARRPVPPPAGLDPRSGAGMGSAPLRRALSVLAPGRGGQRRGNGSVAR